MLVVISVSVVTWIEAGRFASSCGRIFWMLLTTVMVLAPGCRWILRMTAGVVIHPRRLLGVLDAIDHIGDIFDEDRRAVAVGDDDILVVVGVGDLVVGVDLVVLARAIEVALGGVDAGLRQSRAHILHVQAVRGKLRPDSPGCGPRAFGRR